MAAAAETSVVVDVKKNDSSLPQGQLQAMSSTSSSSYGVGPSPFIYTVHITGVVAATLVLVWSIRNRGGLAWNSPNKSLIFNIHPVLMVIGFIFVSSEAILVYKSTSGPKRYRKAVHLVMQAVALLLALLGVWAVVKYHNESNIDNFYSLHSWIGIGTVVLFFIQWVVGFVTFWSPGSSPAARKSALPWHVFFGAAVYVLAVTAAVTGVLEKLTFLQASKVVGRYDSEAFLANFLALVLVLLASLTILSAVLPNPSSSD